MLWRTIDFSWRAASDRYNQNYKQMKKNNKPETAKLRLKAEELLKKRQAATDSQLSETETLKLMHELEVHQIELEMQSEELEKTRAIAQETAEKYIQLYDFAPVGYFTLSQKGEIIELNLRGATMLGKERSLLINKRFGLFVSNETRTIFNHFLDKVMSSLHRESCEVSLSENHNHPFYVQLTGIVSENKEHCLLNMIDITERKQAQDKLKENEAILQKLNIDKDLFISVLAHDLKSPFHSMLGFLELLSKNVYSYEIEKIESQVNIIYQSAQKVNNLLDSILIWAKSQSGKFLFEPKELNFRTICAEIIEILKQFANTKSITINYLAPERLIVFADANMLKTVLRNLISNAIKFTNDGGRIDISAELTDVNVIVSISDNGIGLEPEILDKLFKVSHIQTTKGTANESGSGLGLLYCKDFIEKHGGTIWVESKKGKGSTFRFTLPNK
ncbi:MAG: polar amino acid transport system substrate-binding protein [Bacteroidales bacterium]|nr:polar amino acid transport system substrate-binding protein [Bacteroidales bacterium]